MKWLLISVLACALVSTLPRVSVASPAQEEGLHMIGLDESGAAIDVVIPRHKYAQRLSRLVSSTQASTVPVLAKARADKGWRLRTVVVGVGLGLSVGVGPILELNATPRFRLLFSNSVEPIFP